MKYFAWKILILCVILPPIFYIFTMQLLEGQLKGRYLAEIEDIYIGDTKPLFDGRISLKEAIKQNIDHYLHTRRLLPWGVNVKVIVAAKHEKILYPVFFEEEDDQILDQTSISLATENFNLLNEGLNVTVDLKIPYNTLISYIILILIILLSVVVFYYYYAAVASKIRARELDQNREIGDLKHIQSEYTGRIDKINKERQKLSESLHLIKEELNHEKLKAEQNETDMIEEIVTLEKKIEESYTQQSTQHDEIELLREDFERLEKSKLRSKTTKTISKRFKILYENIKINNKAIHGYIVLSDEMKIKSEKIIQQLNQDPSVISVKRKVFGKKSRKTVFEVIFSYSGRIYFSKIKDKIEVVTIGTKNTQSKDLEFLNNL